MENIFITGAASDIGLSVAERFLQNGYHVILNAKSYKNYNLILDRFSKRYKENKHFNIAQGSLANERFSKEVITDLQETNLRT